MTLFIEPPWPHRVSFILLKYLFLFFFVPSLMASNEECLDRVNTRNKSIKGAEKAGLREKKLGRTIARATVRPGVKTYSKYQIT